MAQARTRKLYSKFRFQVDVDGITSAYFQTATGLEMSIAAAEYAEGGSMAPMKEPGRASYSNLTLSRGVSLDLDFDNWAKDLVEMYNQVPIGSGDNTPGVFRDLTIIQMDREGNEDIFYDCYGCFPVRYKPFDGDNMSDDVQIEELELAIWFFRRYNA